MRSPLGRRHTGGDDLVTRHIVGNATVLHTDDHISAEAQALALAVHQDADNDVVVLDLHGDMPVGIWESVAGAMTRRRKGIRLVVCGQRQETAVLAGQWLSDRLNRSVLAPYGYLIRGAAGLLFVHDGRGNGTGWVRYRPGRSPAWDAKRFPRPAWDAAAADLVMTSAAGVAEPLPGGVWIRDTHDAGNLSDNWQWLVSSLPCLVEELPIVLGCPGAPPLPLDDIARFWRGLDEDSRSRARFVQYGPVQMPRGEALGQVLADLLGTPVICFAGIPVGPPEGARMHTVTGEGTLGWEVFAKELGYTPRVWAGEPAKTPRVISHRAPEMLGEPIAPLTYWYANDAVIEVVQSGLWVRSAELPRGAEQVRATMASAEHHTLIFDDSTAAKAVRMRTLAEDIIARLDNRTRERSALLPASVAIAEAGNVNAAGGRHSYQTSTSATNPPPVATSGRPLSDGVRSNTAELPVYQATSPGAVEAPRVPLPVAAPAAPEQQYAIEAFPQLKYAPERAVEGEITQIGESVPLAVAPVPAAPPPAAPEEPGDEKTMVYSLAALAPALGRAPAGSPAGQPPAAEPVAWPPIQRDPVADDPGPGPASESTAEALASLSPAVEPPAEAPVPQDPAAPAVDEAAPDSPWALAEPAFPPPAEPAFPPPAEPAFPPPAEPAFPPAAEPALPPVADSAVPPAVEPVASVESAVTGPPEPSAPVAEEPVTSTSDFTPPPATGGAVETAEPAFTPPVEIVVAAAVETPAPPPAAEQPDARAEETRPQPTPQAAASAVLRGKSLDDERTWLRRTLSREFDSVASSMSRILSEYPGLQATDAKDTNDILVDSVAVRLYLTPQGTAIDAGLRHAAKGPHVPFARCVAAGLGRLPSHRGATIIPASPSAAAWDLLTGRRLLTEWGFLGALTEPSPDLTGDTDVLIWSMTARRTRLLEPDGDQRAEDRVLFLPGTSFKVLDVVVPSEGGRGRVLIRELTADEIGSDGRVRNDRVSYDELATRSLERYAESCAANVPVGRVGAASVARFGALPGLV